jgi:dihydroorotase
VTSDTTPHHLTLTDDLVSTLDGPLQGQPAAPARSRSRRCRKSPARGRPGFRGDGSRAACLGGERVAAGGVGAGVPRPRDGLRRALHRARPGWRPLVVSVGRGDELCSRPVVRGGREPSRRVRPRTSRSWTSRRSGRWGEGPDQPFLHSPYLGRRLTGRVMGTIVGGERYTTGPGARFGSTCVERPPHGQARG